MMKSRFDRPLVLRALGLSLLMFALAHAFAVFNPTYSGESVMLVADKAAGAQTAAGQYLLPFYWRVRGAIGAPLLVGMISAACLSLSALLTAELLGVRTTALLAALCAALTVNAGATSLLAASLHTADAAFLSQLLATAGVYACFRLRRGALPGALLLFGALGLYAPALSVAAALGAIAMIRLLAAREAGAGRQGAKLIAMLLSGAALYGAGHIAMLRLRGMESAARLHLPDSLAEAFLTPLRALLAPLTIYPALNVLLRALMLLALGAAMLFLARGLRPGRIAAIAALMLLVPLAANLPVYAGEAAGQFPLSYAYIDVLLVALAALLPAHGLRASRAVSAAMLVLALGGGIFANQVYLKKNLEYASALSMMTRVIDRAEQTQGYIPGSSPVAVIGTLDASALVAPHQGFEHLAALDAAKGSAAVASTEDMIWYCWEILGYPFNFASTHEMARLAQEEAVRAMPAFPAAGSCAMIGDTLVIKLSE